MRRSSRRAPPGRCGAVHDCQQRSRLRPPFSAWVSSRLRRVAASIWTLRACASFTGGRSKRQFALLGDFQIIDQRAHRATPPARVKLPNASSVATPNSAQRAFFPPPCCRRKRATERGQRQIEIRDQSAQFSLFRLGQRAVPTVSGGPVPDPAARATSASRGTPRSEMSTQASAQASPRHLDEGREVIVAARIQQRFLGQRARRDQPHHVAFDDRLVAALFRFSAGLFHLFADRRRGTPCG